METEPQLVRYFGFAQYPAIAGPRFAAMKNGTMKRAWQKRRHNFLLPVTKMLFFKLNQGML
ncbi:MAG: hypothetical protein K2X48_01875 [Chitinophagaceae bacterium]|nr:hypothetical protein [Chitinophagaceae bacterium]